MGIRLRYRTYSRDAWPILRIESWILENNNQFGFCMDYCPNDFHNAAPPALPMRWGADG
jgi:hypothetical protein